MNDATRSPERRPQDDKDKSILPALLAAIGILGAAALLIFWPGSDEGGRAARDRGDGADGQAGAMAQGARGGVEARTVDEARAGGARLNPALRLPALDTMVPAGGGTAGPEEPPTFESKDDEIAWYENQLDRARQDQQRRQTFAARLGDARERFLKQNPGPDGQEQWARKEKVVEENLQRAQGKVEELEKKVAQLKGAPVP